MKYDILLKGGTVIDPTQKLHDRRDVAVIDGNCMIGATLQSLRKNCSNRG